MSRGKLIILDGGEGAGKGTVLEELRKVFSSGEVTFTREPGGTLFAEEIRKEKILSNYGGSISPLEIFLWFWLARVDHCRQLIRPSLLSGKHVISDRYDSSTWAYQICAQENHDLAQDFWRMHEALSEKPYMYIYLDVEPVEGLRRAKGRGDINHFDGREIGFHSRVQQGFRQFLGMAKERGICTRIIDANRPLEEVVRESVAVVSTALA